MRSVDSAAAQADRQTGWLISLCAVVFIGTRASLAVGQAEQFASWWVAGSVVTASSFIAMAVVGRRLPLAVLRRLWLWTPLSTLALQLASYGAYRQPGGDALPWVWSLEAAAVSMLVLVVRARYAFIIAVFSGTSVALSAWLFTGAVPAAVLEATPPHVSNVAFVAIFLGIRHRLARMYETERQARDAAERSARVTAESAQRARLARVVHDEVLSVLVAARMFRGETPAALRDEAAHALEVLASAEPVSPTPASSAEAAAALRARWQQIAPQATVEVRTDGSPVPSVVLENVGAAVAEALRNARRHARAGTITVDVALRNGGMEAAVRDDGVGFAFARLEEARARSRHGVTDSIKGRMDDIGGVAEIRSTPGEGTEVRLSWAP